MSTLAVTNPTLLDVMKRMTPDGSIDQKTVEILSIMMPLLDFLPMVEGNLPFGDKFTVRTGLPTINFRKLYGGVVSGKSRTEQVIEDCAMLEAYAIVDAALANLNGNKEGWRFSEEKAFIESMGQKADSSFWYANAATVPEGFTGLTPRYNSTSGETADNMFSAVATNTATCTSIWVLGLGAETLCGIYPKGSQAGLKVTDHGQVTIQNADAANGDYGSYEAMRTHYKWDLGMRLKDWRYASRIHSIDIPSVKGDISSGPDLHDLLIQAVEHIHTLNGVTPVICCNRTMATALRRQGEKKRTGNITLETFGGKKFTSFQGIPVVQTDSLLNTETGLNATAD